MTESESQTLARQADKAAERVSGWPAWRQNLAARAATQPGTDVEPRVNTIVVKAVELVLTIEIKQERRAE